MSVGFLSYFVSLVIVGLVIGGLGRLVIPGPNPIGLWMTFGVGLVGAVLGAIIGGLIGLGAVSIVFEVAISAGLVYMVSGRGSNRRMISSGRRRR
jgi:uncharacterized membrane protein YeaQ/YmgE (transglycosylase-associated protein family)